MKVGHKTRMPLPAAKPPRQSIAGGQAVSKGLPRPGSKLEAEFAMQCKIFKLPKPLREFTFHLGRKWRFDFVFPGDIIVELEGGTWSGGRHTRGKGFESDCHKYNAATLQGYRVGRFTAAMVRSGAAVSWVADMLLRDVNKKARKELGL